MYVSPPEYAGDPQPDVTQPAPSAAVAITYAGSPETAAIRGRGLAGFLVRPVAALAVLVTEYRRAYSEQSARRGRRVVVSGGGTVEYLGRFRAAPRPATPATPAKPPAGDAVTNAGPIPGRRDVFISYSSKDQPLADALCATLESAGVSCWIASRDLTPGEDWSAAIVGAITRCRVMALVLSGHTTRSTHVKREVERAVHHRKVLIPILIEPVAVPPSLEYFISTHQWFDASARPVQPRFGALAAMVGRTLAGLPCPDAAA
jgi:hypothetical protein